MSESEIAARILIRSSLVQPAEAELLREVEASMNAHALPSRRVVRGTPRLVSAAISEIHEGVTEFTFMASTRRLESQT